METFRKWTMTLAVLALGVGVLLMGLRGWMPQAQAQEGASAPAGVCVQWEYGHDSALSVESRKVGSARFIYTAPEGWEPYTIVDSTHLLRHCLRYR